MNSTEFRELLSARTVAAGLSIDENLVDQLGAYFELLSHWNARINLSGFSLERPTAQAVDRLFVEPLTIAQTLKYATDIWLDLGSGGGSPAIPMQLYKPAKLLVLVESKSRKAAFLREVARELGLAGVEVEATRIESIASTHRLAGKADFVTIRAVRPSAPMFETVRNLLRAAGRVALIGSKTSGFVVPDGFQVVPIIELAPINPLVVLSRV